VLARFVPSIRAHQRLPAARGRFDAQPRVLLPDDESPDECHLDWGPEQVRQFNALGRTKLRECYSELRGLVGEIDGDGDDQIGLEPEEVPLVEGQACPACGLPLTAHWLSREALSGTDDDTADSQEGA
jgi:hypothetical protein